MKINIEQKPYDIIYIYQGSITINKTLCFFEIRSSDWDIEVIWLEELPEKVDRDLIEENIIQKFQLMF